jgi:hypothetical protein
MRLLLKITVGFFLVVAVLLGFATLYVWNMPETKELSEFEEKFESVQIGDPEAKALSILGEPALKEKEFRLGQMEGFEDAYARAKASDSEYYLLWLKGIDVVFSVGINNEGKVSAKGAGGT